MTRVRVIYTRFCRYLTCDQARSLFFFKKTKTKNKKKQKKGKKGRLIAGSADTNKLRLRALACINGAKYYLA